MKYNITYLDVNKFRDGYRPYLREVTVDVPAIFTTRKIESLVRANRKPTEILKSIQVDYESFKNAI